MKAPRCRLCGKEHYGLCKESEKSVGRRANLRSSNAAPALSRGRVSPVPSSASSVGSRGNVKSRTVAVPPKLSAPLVDTSTSGGQTTSSLYTLTADEIRKKLASGEMTETIPEKFHRKATDLGFRKLTQAERQKKYREKGGAGLRERERLRMAAKRKEKSGG